MRRLLPTAVSFKTCSSCYGRYDNWYFGSDVFNASKPQLSTSTITTEIFDVLETPFNVLRTLKYTSKHKAAILIWLNVMVLNYYAH
jgi:hypothetical protein